MHRVKFKGVPKNPRFGFETWVRRQVRVCEPEEVENARLPVQPVRILADLDEADKVCVMGFAGGLLLART